METKTSITEKTANNDKANVRRRAKKLKLFVWEDVLTDYTSGVMLVITKAEGFAVWGGG